MGNIIILLLTVIVVGMILGLGIFTVRVRDNAQKLIEQIEDFAAKVNQGEIVLYSDDTSSTTLIDKDGKSVAILEEEFKAAGERCRIVLQGLAAGSNTPDKCYRVAFSNFDFEHDDFGQPTGFTVLYFRPAQCSEHWKVINAWCDQITCRHPVMGTLTFETSDGSDYVPDQRITLRQCIEKTESGRYIVGYKVV